MPPALRHTLTVVFVSARFVRQQMQPEGQTEGQDAPSQSSTGTSGGGALPAINLPKGGGAIRGMGEKFGANPATGTGSLTVPLASSPGRSGFGPQLALAYDSGSGNGVFGFGWSMSLPAITRKTDKGLPRYSDGDESDTFLISGAEDLVPLLDAAGQRVPPRARTLHGVAYRIQLYRPRTEGLFARIERWARDDNGVSHWRSISRDNVTTIYGFNDNSRIRDPHDERRVFSYLINFSFDDCGNATHYEYLPEDSRGVNRAAAHESNRTDVERTAQRYLKRIRYGNVNPFFPDWSENGEPQSPPADWHFHVVFDYGDHQANAPAATPDQPWNVRPDPFSVHRAGFEVRTYRRCERVLLFHQFAGQNGFEQPALVRSTDLLYSDEVAPIDPRNPIYTFLESVTQIGYRSRAGALVQRAMPPLEFFYSQPEVHAEILTLADADSRANLPEGLDGARFRWVDLDGEGMPGILVEQDGGWGYKRNLSPVNTVQLTGGERVTRAHFAPLEQVRTLPAPANLGGGQQLLDLTGGGRLQLVAFDATVPGYFTRTADEDWESFKTFPSLPRLNWSEPNLKFVDLTGDGHADILITEDDVYTFYPSLGADGFGAAERVAVPWDEARGARVVFADGTQTISLADMTGDGLSDIVRVRVGEVCYWPNLGYGHFGARVTMDDAPRFAVEEQFDPRRLRLADVDGSGTTDLLYVGDDGVQVCFNRAGNSWAAAHRLAIFPGADTLGDVQVTDLLGNGTACLVWSSPLPGEAYAALRYVDLMGSQKPHLLVRTRNNLGAETRMRYAPSTRFYLADKLSGQPWITKLPHVVHVVERVETFDWVGRSRFVTRYAYHHGYFDSYEREFRGFGMVEQWDTEEQRDETDFPTGEDLNWNDASWIPPILTRTWFHTGAFVESGTISRQYEHEYWIEPALRPDARADDRAAMLLPDTVVPPALAPGEMREAARALKGLTLRIEVFAADGTPRAEHPYTVTEQNFNVRRVQPTGDNRHAVFYAHPREKLAFHYERQPDDPRVMHDVTLEVDAFGNELRKIAIGYPRRAGHAEPEPALSNTFRAMLAYDQARLHVAAIENSYTAPLTDPLFFPDTQRTPQRSETITAELYGITPQANRPGITNFFRFDELETHWQNVWNDAHDLPYEEIPAADVDGAGALPNALARRIVERTRTLYRRDDLTALLPLGQLQSRALHGQTYQLALTPELVTRIFDNLVPDATLIEGGYVQLAGTSGWWMPAGRIFYSTGETDAPAVELAEAQSHFFLPRRSRNAFGALTHVAYDQYDLLPATLTDPVGNTTTAENDYRILQPFRVTDANGNRTEASFDALGLVAGTAVMGKMSETFGDSLAGFEPDLDEASLLAHLSDPLADPSLALGNASVRTLYDLAAYQRTRDNPQPDPPVVYTLARETHVSALAAGQVSRYQHSFIYTDGFGHEAQKKVQAEPEFVAAGGGGNVVAPPPRWLATGWTIHDNKGNAVRTYEPFFTATPRFEFAHQIGVSAVHFFDPVGRPVLTLHPDDTWEKIVYGNWRQDTWDGNDTALITDPRTDADVGDYFQRLLGAVPAAFTCWHNRRIGGTFGATPAESAAAQDAAQKTEAHAATPSVVHFDSLGRNCLAITDNGVDGRYPGRTALEPEGKPLAVFDAAGRRVFEYCLREQQPGGGFRYIAGHDLAGHQLFYNGMDGGVRRSLSNVAGNEIRAWDARGQSFRVRYDLLQRPTHSYLSVAGNPELLFERSIYGEGLGALNLCGRLFRHYDAGGVAGNERYDFKGNLAETTRQLAREYRQTTNWQPLENLTSVAALDAAAAPLLNAADNFTATTAYDALDRPIQIVTPHSAAMRPNVLRPSYNLTKLLARVDVWTQRATAPNDLLDPATADLNAVSRIEYNARAQRTTLARGNGTITNYAYDPLTFHLSALRTVRPDTFAADLRVVQDLTYAYDPVGNITRIRDTADTQNVIYFRNQRVEPSSDYTYDAIYRLRRATGREHLGQNGGALNAPSQITNDDGFRTRIPHRGDGQAMGVYTENYTYDSIGNLLTMLHEVSTGTWVRRYAYAEPSQIIATENSNRLTATSLPGDPSNGPYSATYTYDAHGSMTRMPHLPLLTWDERDRLRSSTRQVINAGTPVTTYYVYDAAGQRLRKVTDNEAAAGLNGVRRSERLYLGGVEIYREFAPDGVTVTLARETLDIMAGSSRVALVETRTTGNDPAPAQLIRYQYSNHLGSAALELDEAAEIISYEEYFPFGNTSYQAVRSQLDTSKRYRYTGKERDEETDLYYHGARYCACWLGRWTSCDPAGQVDGPNLYAYVRNNPVQMSDPSGTEGVYDEDLGICVEENPTCNPQNPAGLTSVPPPTSIRTVPSRQPAAPPSQPASPPPAPAPSSSAPSGADPWYRFTYPGFYVQPGSHDIFQPVARYDTGSVPLNILANTYLTVSNLCTIPFNAVTEVAALPDEAILALGGSQTDVEAWHFTSMMIGVGEINMLSEAAAASRLASEVRVVQEVAPLAAEARVAQTAAPAIIDANVLARGASGNPNALSAIRATQPTVTFSQLREFLDVNSEVQQTQRAQFLLEEGVAPLSTRFGQLSSPQLRSTFWQIARQQGAGDTTGDAALVIHGLQSGYPIVTGDTRLINTVQQTLRIPGVTFTPVSW